MPVDTLSPCLPLPHSRRSYPHPIPCHPIHVRSCLDLRRPTPHRLERETRRHNRHDDIQRGANVNGDGGGGIGESGDDGRHDAHDAVEADGDAVAGAAVGRGQDLGRVGVEAAVVDVLFGRDEVSGGWVLVGVIVKKQCNAMMNAAVIRRASGE